MKPRQQTSGFPRVNCLVEGCKRGTTRIRPLEPDQYWLDHEGRDPEWICSKHWQRVPRRMKDRCRRLDRAARRWLQINRETSTKVSYLKFDQAMRLLRTNWRWIKAIFEEGHIDMAEIERLFGL